MNEQYEVCWHGALWRTVPLPPRPVLERVVLPMEPRRRRTATPAEYEERVWDVLTDTWQSWSRLRDHAGMASQTLTRALRRLVKQGRIEKHIAHGPTRYGRPQHSYRRRQASQMEAA